MVEQEPFKLLVQGSSPCAPTNVMIDKCIKCNTKIPDERVHLGYRECVECSSIEAYSAHIVYPHKTGAFVQPVSQETKNNLDRLDRRGVTTKTSRHYKTIVKKKSKDSDKTAERIKNRTSSIDNIKLIPYDEVLKLVMNYYDERGYHPTIEYLEELNRNGDIALKQRAEIQDLVVERYLQPSPRALQRKFN